MKDDWKNSHCKECKYWIQTDCRKGITNPSGRCCKPGHNKYEGWGLHSNQIACAAIIKRNK